MRAVQGPCLPVSPRLLGRSFMQGPDALKSSVTFCPVLVLTAPAPPAGHQTRQTCNQSQLMPASPSRTLETHHPTTWERRSIACLRLHSRASIITPHRHAHHIRLDQTSTTGEARPHQTRSRRLFVSCFHPSSNYSTDYSSPSSTPFAARSISRHVKSLKHQLMCLSIARL